MASELFDVIVLGVGGMGSAACYQLARRGLRVLGLEQFEIGHDRGSSHGRSRVIRKAYFEDSRYVPLLHRAYELWRELEKETGVKLLHLIGCLNLGPPEHEAIRGVLESVNEHGLAHEVLDAAEVRRRWPALRPNDVDIGIYETEAGFLVPEDCVRLHVEQARRHGAEIREGERVTRWSADVWHRLSAGESELRNRLPAGESNSKTVSVETDQGRYAADRLIITAGPWLPEVLLEPPIHPNEGAHRILAGATPKPEAALALPLKIERQVQFWFEPKGSAGACPLRSTGMSRVPPADLGAARMPVFIHFVEDRAYYGIPPRGDEGFKVARHHGGEISTADAINRSVTSQDEADVRGYLRQHLPDADGRLLDAKVCMYTNTPDDRFIIDFHPRDANVLIAGGFSGHGFKFSPVVGEIVADLVSNNRTSQPIEFFRLDRFRM